VKASNRTILATALLALAALVPSAVHADSPNRDDPKPTPEAVKDAMTKAANFLLGLKTGDNFETHKLPWAGQYFAPNTGGETALVTYALLHAGRSLDDERFSPTSPELAPVINYLSKINFDGTYAAGLTTLALEFLPHSPTNRERFAAPRDYLERALNRDPVNKKVNGGFSYMYPLTRGGKMDLIARMTKMMPPGKDTDTFLKNLRDNANGTRTADYGNPDGSNTQYGVLGFQAIANQGIEVPNAAWAMMDSFWRNDQRPDGSFAYAIGDGAKRPSMTAAGEASLLITTRMGDTAIRLEPREDPALASGMKAVENEFSATTEDLYYGYALTRVGLASGRKFFGTHNWFRELATDLVTHQHPTGEIAGGFYDAAPSTATAYGLLILARGQNAIPFNKLQYDGPWNARPYDLANLVDKLGDMYEKEFNWQVVPLSVQPEEWMDSPVLLITGSKNFAPSPPDADKIKKFIEMGGLVFSSSDGGGGEFDRSVRTLMKHLFPAYDVLSLKRDNPLFTGELHTKPIKDAPPMVGISNGVRMLWIHSPEDMGAVWQKRSYIKLVDFTVPLNIYFYATSFDLHRTRLTDPVVHPGNLPMKQQMSVARLDVGDSAKVEPFAWQRFAQICKADLLIGVDVADRHPGELCTTLPTVAALTGTHAVDLSPIETQALKDYIGHGGTIFIDAIGGDGVMSDKKGDFINSITALAPTLGGSLADIPEDDAIYKGDLAGSNAITKVDYRAYARPILRAAGKSLNKPHLRGISINGRWAVIVSEEDVTSGLLGTETWGINGYTPDSAVAIAENVLLYAQAHKPK
jgi:hypothetical protein